MNYDEVVGALLGDDAAEEEADREAATFRRELREAKAPDDLPPGGVGEARGLAIDLPSVRQSAEFSAEVPDD